MKRYKHVRRSLSSFRNAPSQNDRVERDREYAQSKCERVNRVSVITERITFKAK